MLDGEIRDAAPGVELVRAPDRLRRADVDTALAGAAMLLDPAVRRQGQVAEDLAEEEPRAGVAAEEQRVLAAPAESSARGELDFQTWFVARRIGGVRLGNAATVEITGLRNPCGQLNGVQPGLQSAVLTRDAEGELALRRQGVAIQRRADPEAVQASLAAIATACQGASR